MNKKYASENSVYVYLKCGLYRICQFDRKPSYNSIYKVLSDFGDNRNCVSSTLRRVPTAKTSSPDMLSRKRALRPEILKPAGVLLPYSVLPGQRTHY